MSKEAIEHYEAALKEAFPSGATGDVFHHWNEARKALAEQTAPMIRGDIRDGLVDDEPAQRTWVGLTDEELRKLCEDFWLYPRKLLQAIEAKLREKNT